MSRACCAPPQPIEVGPCAAKWKSIASGVRNYVAVATSGEVALLDHCGKWRLLPLPFAYWMSITHHGGVFVAVSGDGLTARSTDDGLTWAWGPLPGLNWQCVSGANGVLIAVAARSGNPVIRSTDLGITWASIPAPLQYWRTVAGGLVLLAPTPGAPPVPFLRWVAMADEPAVPIMFSDDQGLSWQLTPDYIPDPTHPEVAITNERTAPGRRWQSVAYGDGLFVAVGKGFAQADRTAISGDGLRWQVLFAPATAHWSHVTFWNHAFVAVAHLDPLSRTDRVMYMPSLSPGSWSSAVIPAALPLRCVVGGRRGLIAMADDGPNGRRAFRAETTPGLPPVAWTQHAVIPCGNVSTTSTADDSVIRFVGGRTPS